MKAVRIHSPGDRSVLQYEDAPRPQLLDGDLLIRVHAAGVNPADVIIRKGYMAGYGIPPGFPFVLGVDVSGVVEDAGSGSHGFRVGDEVFARTNPARDGTYAQYVAVAASDVVAKPATLDHLTAAAVPHAALTAWQALFEAGGLTQGETALVHAAAGGVGHFAVQFAKQMGARVIATASGKRLDFVRGLGADEVIDYTTSPFESRARDVDLVLDTIGGETQRRSWGTLKPGGILVSLIEQPSEEVMSGHGVRGMLIGGRADGAMLNRIRELIDAGKVVPHLSAVFPLADTAQAHAQIESGHTQGKVVLRVVG